MAVPAMLEHGRDPDESGQATHGTKSCHLKIEANLLAGSRYPTGALRTDNHWIRRARDVRYRGRGKPRGGKPPPRRVAAIKVGILDVQARPEDVGLDLAANVIKDINATALIIPAGGPRCTIPSRAGISDIKPARRGGRRCGSAIRIRADNRLRPIHLKITVRVRRAHVDASIGGKDPQILIMIAAGDQRVHRSAWNLVRSHGHRLGLINYISGEIDIAQGRDGHSRPILNCPTPWPGPLRLLIDPFT